MIFFFKIQFKSNIGLLSYSEIVYYIHNLPYQILYLYL